MELLRKGVLIAIGVVCLALSIVFLPVPVPLISLAFFVVGAALLAMSVPALRRWLAERRRASPTLDDALTKVEPIMPDEMRDALAKDQPDADGGQVAPR